MSDSDELRAENEALRRRIAALETSLEARQRAEGRSLVALLDAMPTLTASIFQDGTCEYLTSAFRPWLLRRRAEIIGAPFLSGLIPSLASAAEDMVAAALAGKLVQRELSLPDVHGQLRELRVTVAPRGLEADERNGCIWVAHDLTQLRRTDEALRTSERRLRLATEAAGLGVWDWDLTTGVIVHSDQAQVLLGLPPGKTADVDALTQVIHPEDFEGAANMVRRAIDPAIKEKGPYEYRVVRPDGSIAWLMAHGEAIFEIRDGVEIAARYIGALQDITERTLAARRQQLLLNELNHRVKNTLASVQSIVRLTLRAGLSPDDARARLTDRLLALAGAHDVLTRESWEAADLGEIVASATAPYDAAGASRFVVSGPAVRIAPKTALALALGLHELATNAAKYGALSNASGTVSITWRVEGDHLVLDWRERGGPPVKPPVRTGFGTRLLTRGLLTEFGGDAKLDYETAGLSCHVEAPLLAPGPQDFA
ncbi:MAG TPA: HWE histidine kinase domain-containing protein [Phenylobacterium sp.]|nr:HWE histidine kinase domain-containing protein [Phenylobacterium sp.]